MKNIELIGSINEGNEFLFIYENFIKNKNSIIYIARNDKEIFEVKNKLQWILPSENIYIFRSWDQIPYDNVSPSKNIQSERIKTLYNILLNKNKNILITSVNSIYQKIVNKKFITTNFIKIYQGQTITFNKLINKIVSLGFQKVSLVREKSEFAVRGSIIDIFLTDQKNPIRLDFVDDKIESINEFDKFSQKN